MFIVKTCSDGENWDSIGEFDTIEEAVALRREIEFYAGQLVDSCVVPA